VATSPGFFPGGITVAFSKDREQMGRGGKRNEKINGLDNILRHLDKLGLQWICGRIVGIFNRPPTSQILYYHSWCNGDFRGDGLRIVFFPMDGGLKKEEEGKDDEPCFY
jgi:hypothetical protein